ncbi:MAG: hypothetical protein PUG60_07000, partial [Lachnospiraceae bacterium]|nr:hypothetical protein [Lachnospiraceae bacterium]
KTAEKRSQIIRSCSRKFRNYSGKKNSRYSKETTPGAKKIGRYAFRDSHAAAKSTSTYIRVKA